MERVRIGIVGCGNISAIYLKNCTKLFDNLEVAAVADLAVERARARAEEFGVERACSVEELLGDPSIEIVVNLTIPKAHAQVSLAALGAGKHVYVEKPFALEVEQALRVIDLAREKGLRVGGAPDTFLGAGLQTCRKLIDDGWIGEPVAAAAFYASRGHESWHPDPAFYYQTGGGPLFDMGPYYLTALITLLGPARRVSGSSRAAFPTRTITSSPRNGELITVEVPTHVAGTLELASGAIATIVASFDVVAHTLPHLEIYGSTGTLRAPDPNTFGGPVLVRRSDSVEWKEVPLTHGLADNSRGVGVAELAAALRAKRDHRANERVAFHVLEVMEGLLACGHTGSSVRIASTCERPPAVPPFAGAINLGR